MSRTVILTPKQIREAEGDVFKYLNWDNNIRPYSGHSEIAASGKVGDGNGEPLTTDKMGKMMSPQSAVRYRGNAATRRCVSMRENNDKNGDGIDDFYNNDQLDTLSNGNPKDDTTVVPESVVMKVGQLLTAMQSVSLRPKQVAMVLNKVIEAVDIEAIPFAWRKELSMKLLNNRPNKDKGVK